MPHLPTARERLVIGLDVPDLSAARALIDRLAGASGWLKVGWELFTAAGPAAVEVAGRSANVFLDTKLHDIPHTVAGAVAAATRGGASMMSLHTSGGRAMLRAARESAGEAASGAGVGVPRLLGVTVLTSLTPTDLKEQGIVAASVADQVLRGVDLALEAGLDGVISSPQEAARVRARSGAGFLIVTPGVRSAAAPRDDQARTATPAEAIEAGADLLVVARPILRSPDPAAAARAIVAEIEHALAARTG